MTVLGVAPDPGDYVPSDTLASMRAALDDAGGHVRTGELALASAGLFDAYAAFDDGRGTSGSLFARLDAVGQAASVDAAWLELLDRSSRPDPAGADAVVEAIDAARRALEAGVDAYVRSLAGDGELPITIDVVSATDLAGRPLPSRPSVAARVLDNRARDRDAAVSAGRGRRRAAAGRIVPRGRRGRAAGRRSAGVRFVAADRRGGRAVVARWNDRFSPVGRPAGPPGRLGAGRGAGPGRRRGGVRIAAGSARIARLTTGRAPRLRVLGLPRDRVRTS
ncbi:MAG: hypothetical protein U0470_08710 [Anaerolineae bacterium]